MHSRIVTFPEAIRHAQKRRYEREMTWGDARKMMGGAVIGYSVQDAVMFADGTALVALLHNTGDGKTIYFVVDKNR